MPDRGQHRVQREADEQAHQHRHGHRDAEGVEELADDAAHEGHGHEHRADREGRGHHRETDLVGAVGRGLLVALAHADMSHDVLAHDDGVVDQQADAQAQRHHGHEIQREAEGMHRDEAGDHGDRQGQPGDDGGAPAVQEQEDDGHRQQRAFDQRVPETGQGLLDEVAVRIDQPQLDVPRQHLAQFGHRVLHRFAGGDDIGILLLEDVEADRRLAVDAGDAVHLALALDQGAEVVQRQCQAAAARHHHLAEGLGVLDAALDAQDGVRRLVGQQAHRLIAVCFGQRLGDLGRRHAIGAQAHRIEVDAHLAVRHATHIHLGHALDARQALGDDQVGHHRQLARAAGTGQQGHHDDGLGVVVLEAGDRRRFRILGKGGLGRGDAVAQILHRAAHVGVQAELDTGLHATLEAARLDALDAGDGVQRLFKRLRDLTLDRLGRGAGVAHIDAGAGEGDVGHLLDAQPGVGKQAQHAQGHHHHGREDRVLDRNAGHPHESPLIAAPAPTPRCCLRPWT
mmetsp:Transcript_6442/g.26470  ORF Transcript_6442/g.26470 Transcript_6442/m.26470 type:complete len:511 (+) Transcript_6442:729-2261(+)